MNAKSSMDASVIISVQNRSIMLMDCLRGLAAQSVAKDRFEVVVVDNCSTEDLLPVIEAARHDLGLTVLFARTREDRGPAPARNFGVGLSSGVVLAFTDSDCRPTPRWLELALDAIRPPAVSLVSGPVLPKPEQSPQFTSKLSFVTVNEHPTFPAANLLVRAGVFRAAGGFDESLSFRDPFRRATECADTDLAWRIIKCGHERRFVPEAVMYHELETQGLLLWLLEPTRLFLLPELVRRHPELRAALLTARVVFYPPGVLVSVCGVFCIVASLVAPALLLTLPPALVVWTAYRKRTVNPIVLVRLCARAPLHALKLMVMNVSLLYGSIRFRSLVL